MSKGANQPLSYLTPYPRRGGVITPPLVKSLFSKENHVFWSCGEIQLKFSLFLRFVKKLKPKSCFCSSLKCLCPANQVPFVRHALKGGLDLTIQSLYYIGQKAAKLLAVKVGVLKKKSATSAIPPKVCASAFGPGSSTPGVQSFSKIENQQP